MMKRSVLKKVYIKRIGKRGPKVDKMVNLFLNDLNQKNVC